MTDSTSIYDLRAIRPTLRASPDVVKTFRIMIAIAFIPAFALAMPWPNDRGYITRIVAIFPSFFAAAISLLLMVPKLRTYNGFWFIGELIMLIWLAIVVGFHIRTLKFSTANTGHDGSLRVVAVFWMFPIIIQLIFLLYFVMLHALTVIGSGIQCQHCHRPIIGAGSSTRATGDGSGVRYGLLQPEMHEDRYEDDDARRTSFEAGDAEPSQKQSADEGERLLEA